MPYIDRDAFCLAAPLAVSYIKTKPARIPGDSL